MVTLDEPLESSTDSRSPRQTSNLSIPPRARCIDILVILAIPSLLTIITRRRSRLIRGTSARVPIRHRRTGRRAELNTAKRAGPTEAPEVIRPVLAWRRRRRALLHLLLLLLLLLRNGCVRVMVRV